MKKFTIALLLALAMVFSIATASMAAALVDVKTTSEAITGASGACEKLGSISFTFKAGSVLKDGDWWYADLPLGVTICHPLDFGIVTAAATGILPGAGAQPVGAWAVPDGTTATRGFIAAKDLGTDAAAGNITVAGTSGIWFRVSAASGAHRLLLQAFDSDAAAYSAAANADGTSTLTVGADMEYTIKLLDGVYHTADLAGAQGGYNDTPIGAAAANGVYGDAVAPADNLGQVNKWDNSLCAGAFGHTSATVNVSLNSGGISGANFITFNPTNPEVAHMISAASIALASCKADLYGYVSLTGGQAAVCTFDYETPGNYCADIAPANFKASTVTGNKILIQNSTGTFYDALDNYQLILQVSGNGAYWGGLAPAVNGYTPTNTKQCDADAADAGSTVIAPGWTAVTETGVAGGAVATGTGCGAIAAASQYIRLTSNSFTGINTFNQLEVNLPTIVYDPARFVAGGQVTVTVTLNRLPCGTVFTGTRVVAQFVATCPAAAPTTRLLFPYATHLDGGDGWWFGMSFANPTLLNAVAGTALITVYEDDGDIGTYTTPSIAVGDMVTFGGAELLALLTPDAGNAGTLGDARAHIIVNCNFQGAGGFGMMGNGAESTGYAAYGNSGLWLY